MKNDTPKMSANRQKKVELIADISQKAGKAKALVFTNYEGMTHQQMEAFRKALKKIDAELLVAKNTLMNRSLVENKLPDASELSGATATLFAYGDIVAPLKELAKSIKTLKLPAIKFGIVEGQKITADDVVKISKLPARDVLLTQLVGTLNSPIASLHRALSWNMQKFVMTLKAIESKKPTAS